jgi:hypothetical protein
MSLADSTILPNNEELVFQTMNSGDYMIIVTDVMGCTDSLIVSVIFEGVNTPTPLVYGMYPNPSNGVLNITLSNSSNNANIDIYDMQGRLVFNRGNLSGSGNIPLNLQDLQNGTYVMIIRTDEGIGTSRIVIQK